MTSPEIKKSVKSGYIIVDFVEKLAEIDSLWLDVRMTDMVNRNLKESPDKQFATILSNGIEIRSAWVTSMRVSRPIEKNRAHKVLTATNKLILELNSDLAKSNHLERLPVDLLKQESMAFRDEF